jgi:tetratricopeptide (TPR) repeat protein
MDSISQTLALAVQQHRAGNLKQAEESYQEVLRADPNQAEALNGLGGIALYRGQYAQAIAWQRRAVALQGTNAGMHNNLGAIYLAAGQHGEAEVCCRQALRLKPDLAEAYFNLGNVLKERGQSHDAIAQYQLAVLVRPDLVEASLRLGLILRAEGRRQEALAQLRQALRARPDHAEVHGLLGTVLREMDRRDEAVTHFRQAHRLKPHEARHLFRLGEALLEQSQEEEAGTNLREAVRLQPRWAEAHRLLGRALLKRDRLEEAVSHLQQALQLQPNLPGLHTDLGEALQRQGQLDAALAYFLAERPPAARGEAPSTAPATEAKAPGVPQDKPSSVEDPLTPGIGLRKQGRLDEALAAFDEALRLVPDAARTRYELGVTWKAKNHLDEAIAQYRESVRLDPDLAEAHHALGVALAEQGNFPEAATAFHHALRVKPDYLEAYLNLGKVFREQGEHGRSAAYLRHALRLRPDLVEGHYKLGLTLIEQGQLKEAAAAFREAVRLQPDAVGPLNQLGTVFLELGQVEEGHRLLKQALDLAPEDPEIQAHYGRALISLGRQEEGKGHLRQALALQPEYAPAHFYLARDCSHSFTDAEISRIKDLLIQDHLPLPARIDLHFALARILDRARAFDEAFWHCDQGNACRRQLRHLQGTTFRSESHAQYVDRLRANFDEAYFDRVRSFGNTSDLPVFIVGMPRSGSSLVEQILASHPGVFGGGEVSLMTQLVAELPAELASTARFPECLASLDLATSRRLAEEYLERLRHVGGEKVRVTDKMLMNTHHLGLIATLLPRSQVIHCRRDPRDVCWSCYFQNFRDVAFACDLEALVTYYRQYERLMAHWKAVLPVPIYDVCYEELVEDPERISREMIAFCRLPWHDACLRFTETRRPVRTSSDLQVRQPISKKAVGYWKNYASHLGPLLEALNLSGDHRPETVAAGPRQE